MVERKGTKVIDNPSCRENYVSVNFALESHRQSPASAVLVSTNTACSNVVDSGCILFFFWSEAPYILARFSRRDSASLCNYLNRPHPRIHLEARCRITTLHVISCSILPLLHQLSLASYHHCTILHSGQIWEHIAHYTFIWCDYFFFGGVFFQPIKS